MGTKATRKDFYMEIRKSFGRFLSIFLIVALGVAFFSGIRSSQPDMLATGDAHFDKANLMDVKVVSTLGLTKADVSAMKQLHSVENAVGSYSMDVLCEEQDTQSVLHLMSVTEDMNKITVTSGRMPEKPGECLVDDVSGYKVGDTIKLSAGEGESLEDSLKTDTLKVVGAGNTAYYISHERGSSQIGTGVINTFAVLSEDSFVMKSYSEIYIMSKGAKTLEAYSKEYEENVANTIKDIKDITDNRGEIRIKEIKEEAEKELKESEEELNNGKKKAEEELQKANQKLIDGEAELAKGRQQAASGEAALKEAKALLISKQQELNAAKEQYESGMIQLNEGKASYEAGLSEFQKSREQYGPQIDAGKSELDTARKQLDEGWMQYEALMGQVESGGVTPEMLEQLRAGLEAGEKEYLENMSGLQAMEGELNAAEADLNEARVSLEQNEALLVNAVAEIKSGQEQIDAGWSELNAQSDSLNSAWALIAEGEEEISKGKQEYETAKGKAEQEIADGNKELEKAREDIDKIKNPKWYVDNREKLPEYSGFGDNADRMKAIGRVFPVLFFLVAALISLTSMTRMVEEQRTQIGTLKALGYSKFAIASKYLGYALAATVGGSILGVLVGEKVLPYIIIIAYRSLYYSMTTVVAPYNLYYAVTATAAAVVCTMGATVISCYRELACEPAVLMRPPAPKKGKRVFVERITFLWRRLSFIWKSTIRNLFRYKKRFFMTVFGIGGCMALILVGFGLRDSILRIGDIQYQDIEVYDASIYLQDDIQEKDQTQVYEALDEEKNIEEYLNMGSKRVTLLKGDNEWDAYRSVPQDTKKFNNFVKLHDRITKKKQTLTDTGVILSEKTAKFLDAEIGDTIEIEDEDKGNKKVRVENICENYIGHYIYISPVLYEQIYEEKPEYNSICFRMTQEGKEKLKNIGETLLKKDGVMYISYLKDIAKQLEDMLKSLNMVMVVLIISAGLLAFIVLYNLNNINITERKRELATIKVLGFYDMEVGAYVYRENMILTFVGALAGVMMGYFLHAYVIQTVEVDDVMFGRVIHISSYVYSTLFTFAFSFFVNWVMFFKLRKIDMVESLKSVE